MTLADAAPAALSWSEPDGIAARGTVVVVPGRGERPELYRRFGARIAVDGYRVVAVGDPTADEDGTRERLAALFGAEPAGPRPFVLAGSDSGALFAAGLLASGEVPVDGLVLAGLPVGPDARLTGAAGWGDEVEARTACPTHQGRLDAEGAVRRGALREELPTGWAERADPAALRVPVLGVHGADDVVSPLAAAQDWYSRVPAARLVSIAGGRHDAFNDQTHRSAAAETVLFLERLRLGAGLPVIARVELDVAP